MWFGRDVRAFPLRTDFSAKAQHARSEQRNTDNFTKHWFVTMPANTRVWTILNHQRVLKGLRLEAGERSRKRTQRKQKLRNVVRFPKFAAAGEFILPPERDGAAFALMTVKLKRSKRQLTHVRQ